MNLLLRRPQGVEGEFFVQLFVEPEKSQKLPCISYLLEKMFTEQSIKFSQVCVYKSCTCTMYVGTFVLKAVELLFMCMVELTAVCVYGVPRYPAICWYRSRGMGNISRHSRELFQIRL